jgi:hypothetical protein
MRASVESTMHPSLRFLVVSESLGQLKGLIRTLAKGIVPEEINFCGANYGAVLVNDVLHNLIETFTQPAPTRRNPRRKISVNLKVANGFSKILEQADVGLNFINQESEEIWEVEDISVTGFRCVLDPERAEGIKIGTLLGSKPENVHHWGAGIVRRLSRDEKDNLHVGVEVLSPRIVGVSLTDRNKPTDEGVQLAMYLNRVGDTSGEAWLLMKPDAFSLNRSLHMEMDGRGFMLLPLALVENGDDYDLARYRSMEKEAPAL